ncbi:hypothetical protein PYW07_013351 [Mythimna separata]|uniref:NACHT domain-containing protein n=1 Tax=Mythimna separata TaxID=271217 RepID=A0AAD7Y637_MYTSE|nr:hypothetical protein PYW07_013351 [Mythimna separata]
MELETDQRQGGLKRPHMIEVFGAEWNTNAKQPKESEEKETIRYSKMNTNTYKKRAGTSGIQGQLYETKLISLIYFRMIHDDSIKQFSLATNRDDIGAFDDISFKADVKGFEKPLAVFIQAKHRENDKLLTFTSKTDLTKYFGSYLEIRRAFEQSSKDMIFGGKFDETECFFVMYTTAKDNPNNKTYEGNFAEYLNELIGTGGYCTQPSYTDEDLDFLCKIVIEEEITTLAEQLAKFICDESNSEMSTNNDIMLRYHVILALNVFDVSEIQPEGHRIASFRQDFFTNNEEFIVLIKNILCLEVLKRRKSEKTDGHSLLLKFFDEPSEITTLSKLMESVLTFKNNKLEFISKSNTDDERRQLDKAKVPQSDVYKAAELAAKEYLLSLKLKVPASFGNKDLTIRGKVEKVEKRLNHLTSKIKEILELSKPNNIVTIDESLGDGFLQLNGGIASAVGNILIFNETSKLLQFSDNCESLSNLAKRWYELLTSEIHNLHEYKLDVKVKNFPKLSFERGDHDVNLVKDFYSKLLFYTNQADQNGVEEILREEIEDKPCNDANNFKVRSDVIFLKYHDEIQKLWMAPKVGSYLTKKSKIYESAVSNTMSEPLMGLLNILHMIKNKDYKFNENAIKQFELHGEIVGTAIRTGSCVLTVAKVEQYLGNTDHVVLDLEYIFKLPLKSHNNLCKELTDASKEKILIIVCDNFQHSKNSSKRFRDIAKAVDGKQTIITLNKTSVDIVAEYFYQASNVLIDDSTVFTDLSDDSQKKLLATAKVKFQDANVSLETIVDDESAKLVDEEILNQLINNETIVIGKTVCDCYYEKAKPFYIDRRVSRTHKQGDDDFVDVKDKVVNTLYDLEEDVVLITAMPGMGKSTLLTHLSLKTKELDPKIWILRINLLEHSKMFSKWQDDKTVINTLESLKFICQVALSEESDGLNKECKVFIELEESPNGIVNLNRCSGGNLTLFQLNMFLHFYNRGKLIFVFDGFDEIFPHYEREALSLLKSVRSYPRQHKVWITSRSFNHIKSILEQEFGQSYEIEHFNRLEQDTYLYTYWKSKILLENLNNAQIQNVHDFVHFMKENVPTGEFCIYSKIQHKPYFKVYMNFLEYLKVESIATDIDFSYAEYNSNMMEFDSRKSVLTYFTNDFIAPPLHLYLLAEYFHNKIIELEKTDNKWNIEVTGYIFYEYYLETKLRKIRFQEKNKIDIFNPDNKIAYENERADSVAKHKKLGAYAMFYPHVEVFEEAELREIEDIIDKLRDGRDKNGLIRTVVDNIPLFVHMSFAEYFAVEYICDFLKNENSEEKQVELWKFVLNVMFYHCGVEIFDIFNTKMKVDDVLRGVAERDKKIIFHLLYEQKNRGVVVRYSDYEKSDKKSRGMDFDRTDRYMLNLSMFSYLWENSLIDQNIEVDFEKFFNIYYFVTKHDRSFTVPYKCK